MNIVSVFEWFAEDSAASAVEHTDEQQQSMWMKLADQWAAAARLIPILTLDNPRLPNRGGR